ncbi:Serologically defined colon cancer antigen 8-like protein [Trichoplax sp. H2]|nr:Serologically defined colon cancer antigen 8-like protein [Trichoplax sp. H2]|eukprot:RDD44353.1 Serologically defined colon cancer antigen 8-like protein [Trichoplax sp. H2]
MAKYQQSSQFRPSPDGINRSAVETKIPTLSPSWKSSYAVTNSASPRNYDGDYNTRASPSLTKYFNAGDQLREMLARYNQYSGHSRNPATLTKLIASSGQANSLHRRKLKRIGSWPIAMNETIAEEGIQPLKQFVKASEGVLDKDISAGGETSVADKRLKSKNADISNLHTDSAIKSIKEEMNTIKQKLEKMPEESSISGTVDTNLFQIHQEATSDQFSDSIVNMKSQVEKCLSEIKNIREKVNLINKSSDQTQEAPKDVKVGHEHADTNIPVHVLNTSKPINQVIVDRLTSERDEALQTAVRYRKIVDEMCHKEVAMYKQIKNCVETMETMQMEKKETEFEVMHAKEEIARQQEKYSRLLETISERCMKERQNANADCQVEIQGLQQQIKSMEDIETTLRNQIDRQTREKTQLLIDLEQVRSQLMAKDVDSNQLLDKVNSEVSLANIERNNALDEAASLRLKLTQERKERERNDMKLKSETEGLQRRLRTIETELMASKDNSLQLTQQITKLEQQSIQISTDKDSRERGYVEEINKLQSWLRKQEADYMTAARKTEIEYQQSKQELQNILDGQIHVCNQWKDSSNQLAEQLQEITDKYGHMKNQSQTLERELQEKLHYANKTIQDLGDYSNQQDKLISSLRERLEEEENSNQKSANQNFELLTKQSSLLRDRQLLTEEIEYLKLQLAAIPAAIPKWETTNNASMISGKE